MRFRDWLENYEGSGSQKAQEYVDRMKSFVSSLREPSPGYNHRIPDQDRLDVAAVVAGTKPAALLSQWGDPVVRELLARIEAMPGYDKQINSYPGKTRKYLVVGKTENVRTIISASDPVVLGNALGYHPDAVSFFQKNGYGYGSQSHKRATAAQFTGANPGQAKPTSVGRGQSSEMAQILAAIDDLDRQSAHLRSLPKEARPANSRAQMIARNIQRNALVDRYNSQLAKVS